MGLGAVLAQEQVGTWMAVSSASRSLTYVERRYSQTEKEALASVWACERFNMYLSGRNFELETDHTPLERIYSRTSKPRRRIGRWVLRLQGYDFKVVYWPGKTNIADALSRLNYVKQLDRGEEYDFIRAVVESCVPVALSPKEIEASYGDEELCLVNNCVKSGNWEQCTIPSYAHVKDALCTYGESMAKIIEAITPMFVRFGVPFSLRTDNGPQFVSEEFESFLQAHGVDHRRTTPLWPQANGEVERQNRSLLKCLQIAYVEGKNCRTEFVTWLAAYRSTPQAATGASPFSLMFGREMRTKLPELRRETVEVSREEVRDRDWSNKLKGKAYVDARRGATPKSIRIGDTVLLKAEKSNKLSTNFRPSPFKVVQKTGTEVTVRNEAGEEFWRNSAFIRKAR